MNARIIGMAVWRPERVIGNDAWPQTFVDEGSRRGDRVLNDVPLPLDPVSAAIVRPHLWQEADPFLGARMRPVADPSMTSLTAEIAVAHAALRDAGLPGSACDYIIGYAMVPDRITAPTVTAVANAIDAHKAHALFVETACASALTSIELGAALIAQDPTRVILAVQSHVTLRAMPFLHPATPGLGDVATAFVMTGSARGGLAIRSAFGVTHGQHHFSVVWRRGHDAESDVPWFKGRDEDFRLGTYDLADVKYLQRETVSFGAMTVEEAARRAGIDVGMIDVLASVQPRQYIPGCIAERLGLPRGAAVETFDTVAHVGACGPVYNLWTARERGLLQRPGTIAALYGQGAGFTRAAAILEVEK